MKKELILLAVCAVVGIIAHQFKVEHSSINNNSGVVLSNIDALMTPENSSSESSSGAELSGNGESLSGDGESSNSGEEFNRENCLKKGGNWNMASVCVDGGIIQKQCEISGEITILGATFKGSYKKGKLYNLAWERYSCQNSQGNCCTKQGVFVKPI